MMNKKQPIGIFDSGFGGLTVFKAVRKLMPGENIIYFGDTARVPYGTKSADSVIGFSKQISEYLMSKKIKMLVVACNTSSALALDKLRRSVKAPVIGVIHPSVNAVCADEKNKKILILATSSTVKSRAYSKQLNKKNKNLLVYEKACPLFVPIIEEGCSGKNFAKQIVKEYLLPLKKKKFDAMILGCTHYPILKKVIKEVMGKRVTVINSSAQAALKVYEKLFDLNLLNKSKRGKDSFIVSDDPKKFTALAGQLLDIEIKKLEIKRF
ncbi:MAG: glutamate racemase [Elusimicrobiales bacterium]|nr:glutamate racemase [Elusimicrobiales bacterium]MCK5583198.1 glutamate racemase [Elusimicrobiales bacterium]